jgi:hypothetical protein
MYQAVIGGMNFFGLYSEREANRKRFKDFGEIRGM